MLLQKLACKGVARFSAYEILDLHTGLTVLPVGSNGAHIKGVATPLLQVVTLESWLVDPFLRD